MAALLMLAALVPPFVSRELPLTQAIERLAYDFYTYLLVPKVPRDPDIVLLLYDDPTARDTGKTSPVDRTIIANAVRAADQAGAKSIGIDFFFVQPTEDEDALTDALARASVPVVMLYADPDRDGGSFWSAATASQSIPYQAEFWRQVAPGGIVRSSPMIGNDDDDISRDWPTRAGNTRGTTAQVPLSAAMAGMTREEFAYSGSIAFSRFEGDPPIKGAPSEAQPPPRSEAAGMFTDYSLIGFRNPASAEALGPLLADKHVLIGLGIFNADRFATPITRIAGEQEIPGVAVHAHMLRQALDRNFPDPLPLWAIALVALVFAGAGALVGSLDRSRALIAAAVGGLLAVWVALPLLFQAIGIDLLSLPMFGWSLSLAIALVGFSALAGARTSRERAFARGALGRYLPATVAQEILDNPEKLTLEGEERELFMLFTDLEGFTRISHAQPPRDTAAILNRYLDAMSEVILQHEGTIDKYVGDAIVAFWGAPIARPDDARNAVACALALHACAESFRADLAAQGGELGRTRIGLHCGSVIVGNFGGRQRIQYTALGDAMNTAARLEGANKHLASDILLSEAVRGAAPEFAYLPLGRIVLSGVDTPIAVYQPVPEIQRPLAGQAQAALDGDTAALVGLRLSAANVPAVASLLERWDIAAKGEAYVLGSK
jgi:adenylate cyclase